MSRPPVKSPDEKLRIALAVVRGEVSISPAARREGVWETSIAKWRDQFLEAGRTGLAAGGRLARDPVRAQLEAECEQLKAALGEAHAELRVLKKGGPTDIVDVQSTEGMSATIVGLAWCSARADPGALISFRCDRHTVRSRFADMSVAVASRETGHTYGRTHPTNASPASVAGDATYCTMQNAPTTGALCIHNTAQLNVQY